MKSSLLTFSYALSVFGALSGVGFLAHICSDLVIYVLGLSGTHTVVSFYGAELASRIAASVIVCWKLSAALREAGEEQDLKALLSQRGTLLTFALLAFMFMGLDNRLYWWLRYVFTGLEPSAIIPDLTAYRASFTALAVNLIALILLDYKTRRGYLIGFGVLSLISLAGFIAGYVIGANK